MMNIDRQMAKAILERQTHAIGELQRQRQECAQRELAAVADSQEKRDVAAVESAQMRQQAESAYDQAVAQIEIDIRTAKAETELKAQLPRQQQSGLAHLLSLAGLSASTWNRTIPPELPSNEASAALDYLAEQSVAARRAFTDAVSDLKEWHDNRTRRRVILIFALAFLIALGVSGYFLYRGWLEGQLLQQANAALQAAQYADARADFAVLAREDYGPAKVRIAELAAGSDLKLSSYGPSAPWIASGLGFALSPSASTTAPCWSTLAGCSKVQWVVSFSSNSPSMPALVTFKVASASVKLPSGQTVGAGFDNASVPVQRGRLQQIEIDVDIGEAVAGPYQLTLAMDVGADNFTSHLSFEPVTSTFLFF